MSIAMSKEDM